MEGNLIATKYYVYIVANELRNKLKVGITIDLQYRLQKLSELATPDCCIHLVYYEQYATSNESVKRESQLSTFSQKKIRQLVEEQNSAMITLRIWD